MNKEQLINKLTLLDTSSFRCIGFSQTKKYTKEPVRFRKDLHDVYSNLNIESLQQLLKIRSNENRY